MRASLNEIAQCLGLMVHSGEIAGKIHARFHPPTHFFSLVGTLWKNWEQGSLGLGSDDAEQLALTEQLFDVFLGELGVVAGGQRGLIERNIIVEPTKIPLCG